jgi:hypothetical protein
VVHSPRHVQQDISQEAEVSATSTPVPDSNSGISSNSQVRKRSTLENEPMEQMQKTTKKVKKDKKNAEADDGKTKQVNPIKERKKRLERIIYEKTLGYIMDIPFDLTGRRVGNVSGLQPRESHLFNILKPIVTTEIDLKQQLQSFLVNVDPENSG